MTHKMKWMKINQMKTNRLVMKKSLMTTLMRLHIGKPFDNLEKLHFNFKTETYAYVGSQTMTYSEHKVRYNEMFIFDKTTVKVTQKMHFQ